MKSKANLPYFLNEPSNKLQSNFVNGILKENNAMGYHTSLPNYEPTSLLHLPKLSKKYNVGNIYVKDESARFGLKAFKVLGASYAMHQLLANNPEIETFCTASDGNHGKAVAWTAKLLNKKAVIYVPQQMVVERIKAIQNEGATVEKINGSYDDACELARKNSSEQNWCLVQDTTTKAKDLTPALIMQGYMTMFVEMESSINVMPKPKIDIIFLQAGVGSFAGSAIFYYLNRYGINRPKIVLVEPMHSAAILHSFKKAEVSTLPGKSKSIMAGLCCETPSVGAWSILNSGADISIKIEDKYAKKAMQEFYLPKGNDPQIISGESGAAGFAGFLAVLKESDFKPVREILVMNKNSNILFINTEGATDLAMFNKIIEEQTSLN